MIRALIIATLSGMVFLLAACQGGGGGDTTPLPGEELALELFAISPSQGTTPFQATLTTVVSGGRAPYDYAWDFENDGSFDAFTNNTFDTTVSRPHQYDLRAADAGGASTYQAIVRVTDSNGEEVTSDPRSVTVTASTPPIVIDPNEAFIEDELGNRIDPANHVFTSGERLKFHYGDRSSLLYQWDFIYQTIDPSKPIDNQISPVNPTFVADATTVSPTHIYYNTGATPLVYLAQVRVRDPQTGQTATYVFTISVAGTNPAPTDSTLEAEINSDPPVDSNGTITLRFDPNSLDPAKVPTEPRVDYSAKISDDPAKAGDPPYEYYWDFENDGKIDKAAQSPSVPYYDAARKITINPYMHNEDERTFEVRLLVIDNKGRHDEVIHTVRVINIGNRPPAALSLGVTWGFGDPLKTHTKVDAPTESVTGTFTIVPRGSTGIYEFKLDIDGDGLGDYDYVDTDIDSDSDPDTSVLDPGADAWVPISEAGTTVSVIFGPRPDPNDPNVPPAQLNEFPVPNYYAAQVIVRSLDQPNGAQIDKLTRQTPVSIVELGDVNEGEIDTDPLTEDVTEEIPSVQDHVMVGFSSTAVGGGNGEYLQSRGVLVAGGARGTSALRDVFRIVQTFDQPDVDPGDLEIHDEFLFSDLAPMNVARRGHAGFLTWDPDDANTGVSDFYAWGGRNPANGPQASGEFQAFDPVGTTEPWIVSGTELRLGGQRYPLYDFGVAPFQDVVNGFLALFTGGINQATKESNANVSGRTFLFGPGAPGEPADDGFGTFNAGLSVPRYDLATVVIGTQMYAIGGRSSNGQSTATVETVDLGVPGDTWKQLPNMKDARAGCSAEVIDSDGPTGPKPPQIYVYGGAFFPGQAGSRTLVNTAEVFNPATQTWIYTEPLTEPGFAGDSARLPGPGSVKTGSALFNTVWYYGGESGATVSLGETNRLQEFIYFYNVP